MAKTTIPGMHSESTPMDFFGFLEKYGKKYTGADIAFNLDPSKPLSEQARYTRGSVFEAMQLTLTGEISGDKYFQEKIIPRLLDNDSELTSLILDDKFAYDFAGKHRGTPFLADPSAFYKEGLERKLEARELHRERGTKRPIDPSTGKRPLMSDETLSLVSRARDDGEGGRTRDFVKGRKDKILRGEMSRVADRVLVPAETEIGRLEVKRGKWTGRNEAGWFNLQREGTKGGWEGLVNVAESHVISHPTKGPLKAHGAIRPKIYFGIDDQTKVAGAIPRITDYLDEKFGDNPAFSFKVEENLKKTSVPHTLTSDFIVMHAASQEGTEKSVLEQTQRDIAKILQEEGAGSLSTELGFDYGLYGLDESGNPLLQNKIIGGSYTNILDMQLEMATRDSKDSPFTKDVIEQLRGVDPESELGKDLARLGILDDLGVTPGAIPTPVQQAVEQQGPVPVDMERVRGKRKTTKKVARKTTKKKQRKKVIKSSAETSRGKIIEELQKTWQDGPYDSPVTRDLLDQLNKVDPETAEFIEGTFDLTKQFEDWSEDAGDSPQVLALREKFQDLDKKAYDRLDREVESGVDKKLPREELDARVRESIKEQLEVKASTKKAIKKTTKKVAKKTTKKVAKKTTRKTIRKVAKKVAKKTTRKTQRRRVKSSDTARVTTGRPPRGGRPSTRPRTNSSAGAISFWFDVEATDIGFSHQDKVIKDGKLVKIHRGEGIPTHLPFNRLGPKETAPVQITQMYGQIHGREVGSRLPKEYSRYMHLDLPSEIDPRKIDIEFEHARKANGAQSRPNLLNSEIERIMKKGPDDNYLSRGRGDITARKAMLLNKGKFIVRDQTVLGRITASGRSNPTAGNFGLGVKLVGSTLNTVLGKNVFMSKYGHEDMISSQKFVSEFMTTMSDLNKEAKRRGIRAEVVGWNVGYDITKVAENIDLYGKDLDIEGVPVREVFKRLFIGTTGSHAEQTIRIVDAQDRVKDIQFWKLIHDDNYNLQNINHKEVRYLLKTGKQSRDQIKQSVYTQIKEKNTGRGPRQKLIQNNTAMKELAGHVSTQKRTPQSKDAIESILLRKIDREASHGSFDWTSDEGKVVRTSANMIRELAEVDHASGGSSTEVIRRNVQSLRNTHKAEEMLSKMFRHTSGTGGIMGFDNAKDIRFTERGGLTRGMLEQMGTYATGTDIGGGNSLTGGGGVVENLIWAKGDYISTHNARRSAPLAGLFHDIDQLKTQNFSASAHEASTDVKQMMASVINIFDKHMINPRHGEHTEMNEFMGIFMEKQKMDSAAKQIDSYHSSQIIEDAMMGGEVGTRPDPQTIEAAGDAASEVAGNLSDAVRDEGVPSVAKSIKRRQRGVLGVAAFTLAGLALIGNRNGGIKHPGTDYNSIEGMSPSGDPLLHSFGSGNDSFQSQALSNITYGTHYGSNTIRASSLGYRGDRLRNMLLGISSFDDYTKSSEKGTLIHSIIEAEYLKSGIAQASEHTVHSSELDVMGHIDLILKSGVPLEIKTVADYDALENLKSPREAHVSQANFYAYALKQPYALIGYAARNDPKKVKYFKINTNINRIMKDVKEVRSMMSTLRAEGHTVQNYSAYQMMKDVQARARQDKYKENAVNSGMGMPPGMLASPENYGGYSGIASFGDYKRWIKKALWKQENKLHLTQSSQFKSKSRIRNQGKHAALHSNNNVRYSKAATHVNKSRQQVNYNWPKATQIAHRMEAISSFSG